MKMVLSALLVSCFLLTSGCQTIQITPPTPEQQVVLVQNTAKVATVLTIRSAWKDDPQYQIEKAKAIRDFVAIMDWQSPLVSDWSRFPYMDFVDRFITIYFSGDAQLYIQSALDVLASYVNVDASGIFTAHQIKLIQSFFLGIEEGCNVILSAPCN